VFSGTELIPIRQIKELIGEIDIASVDGDVDFEEIWKFI